MCGPPRFHPNGTWAQVYLGVIMSLRAAGEPLGNHWLVSSGCSDETKIIRSGPWVPGAELGNPSPPRNKHKTVNLQTDSWPILSLWWTNPSAPTESKGHFLLQKWSQILFPAKHPGCACPACLPEDCSRSGTARQCEIRSWATLEAHNKTSVRSQVSLVSGDR